MSILEGLNPQQAEAVRHFEGPLLILAGAGSGKTRVLTNRVAWLIGEKNVPPWNILAITFTNKAAGEMRQRVDRMVSLGADAVWVATFHSTCVRILRRYIDCLGYKTNFVIYDTDDQKSLMKEVCKKLQIDTRLLKERAILSAISSAKDELIAPAQFRKMAATDYFASAMADAYDAYQAALKNNNALDFDDLIFKCVELFRAFPEVLQQYRDRFRFIMVDEYQDTNTAQFELVRLLAGERANLCVVGDDDQSIYRFRGANIQNILSFEKHYPGAKVIRLEQNYRSTGNILDVANAVIANNRGRKRKTLWTENGEGKKVRRCILPTASAEAEMVANEIGRRCAAGEAAYNDFAVLYRTNAQSRLLEEKLLMAGIPYRIVGGVNFYARREVKDLLSYLKTVENGMDDLAVRRIINVPRRGIGTATINRMQAYADVNGLSLYEAMTRAREIPGIGRSAARVTEFVGLIEALRSEKTSRSVHELLEEVIARTGYVTELEAEGTDEARDRIQNIQELITKAYTYEQSGDETSLGGFLEEVSLVADIDTLDENAKQVLLMTMHSAKGLEFPCVYLTGMEEGLFPSFMSISEDGSGEGLEEERRLCYVGITRAMRELTLTCARMRMVQGQTRYNVQSRFLEEIPGELLDEDTGRSRPARSGYSPFPGDRGAAGSAGPAVSLPPVSASRRAYDQARKAFHEKVTPTPRTLPQKADSLPYDVGDRVRHMRFGEGTVLKIVDGGRDYEVSVEFDKAGIKKMFAGFAKLEKI